ncbi:Transcriptional regulator TetR family [Patulibacter medicamentivorans]|uniref:Transcriptional regulator TetR family n=1 Tax=Patulibacter medicamentivorans TaxID=1097667 RepID=H0E9E2_9ACTN|nr:TetR/AcrR family transcriptional regulator [Patulibacter medicamentivorans]EHN09697.1 Transcriptional regulator TetR family [Patulibacter medicamentivorans]
MPPVVRPYRGISADERRAQRRAQLLDAALDVIGDVGLAGLTMTAVCARAGLTERYFYESFRDRDALIRAMTDEVADEVVAAITAALAAAPRDLFAVSRAAIAAAVHVLTDDPRKARAMRDTLGSELIRDRQEQLVALTVELLSAQILDLGDPDAIDAVRLRLATTVIVAGTLHAIGDWIQDVDRVPLDEIADEVARLCVAAAGTVAG